MRYIASTLPALVIACSIACAAELPPGVIHVTGSADAYLAPDAVTIGIVLETKAFDVAVAKTNNNAQINQVMDALREVGIQKTNIQAGQLTVRKEYIDLNSAQAKAIYQGQQGGVTEREKRLKALLEDAFQNVEDASADKLKALPNKAVFTVTRSLNVRLTDLAKFEPLIEALTLLGVAELSPCFTSAKTPATQRDIYISALRDARRQADDLAREAGIRIIGVQNIGAQNYGAESLDKWIPKVHPSNFTGGRLTEPPIEAPQHVIHISASIDATFLSENQPTK